MSVEVSDPIASLLVKEIEKGINAINEANEVLLAAEDSATGVREIDKALKGFVASDSNDVSELDADVVKAVAAMVKAQTAFKNAQEKARNTYRTNVLGVEEVSENESDVDEAAVKEQRKVTMQSITLLGSIAESNGFAEVLEWLKHLEVPQVGRAGTSVVGAKKPRAYVSVSGTTHNTFGEAAKAISALLSTENNKVEVTSPELTSAWVDSGQKDVFEFQGLEVKVTPKESKKSE